MFNTEITLANMGFSQGQLSTIRSTIEKNGGILVCGPTGSGKKTFISNYIKEFKRSRENILWLDEARRPIDVEHLLSEASIADNWCSTVHASTPLLALRKIDGISQSNEFFMSPDNVKCVIGLQLANRVCPHCALVKEADEYVADQFDGRDNIISKLGQHPNGSLFRLTNPKGCEKCNNDDPLFITGNVNRHVCIADVMVPNTSLMQSYLENGSDGAFEHYNSLYRFESEHNCSGESMIISGLRKMLSGELCVSDFDHTYLELQEVADYLKYIEQQTLKALADNDITLRSHGGFSAYELIKNEKALTDWRLEYLQQTQSRQRSISCK